MHESTIGKRRVRVLPGNHSGRINYALGVHARLAKYSFLVEPIRMDQRITIGDRWCAERAACLTNAVGQLVSDNEVSDPGRRVAETSGVRPSH